MATPSSSHIEQICEKVDLLLMRHEQLRHQNEQLQALAAGLTQQRDALQARLAAALGRVDALLARLPPPAACAAADGAERGAQAPSIP